MPIEFRNVADAYGDALKIAAELQRSLPSDRAAVIYRVSKSKDETGQETVYLSRQLDPQSNGEEVYPRAKIGTTEIGYEIYSVPRNVLTTSTPPDETELSNAVAAYREQKFVVRAAGDPQPAGPNVVGPSKK